MRAGFAAFVAAVAVASVAAPVRADTVGTIRGTVAGATAPVTVRIDGDGVHLTTTTDHHGSFAFARVPFGRYAVIANGLRAEAVVGTDAVVDVTLAPSVIGATRSTARSVRGNPVSDNTLDRTTLAELPRGGRLNDVVQTMPGIVRFSYDEPVAHGFHGIAYELDGIPLPRNTSQNFSDLFDLRDAQSVEVLTGAFPAEFGGTRQGAVVNVRSRSGGPDDPHGTVTFGGGTLGSGELNVSRHAAIGASTDVLGAVNLSRTSRGIDSPSRDAVHDDASLADAFVRIAHRFDQRTTLALDAAGQHAAYQIPGTSDVQREDDRFVALSLTRTSRDGNGFVQIAPWARTNGVRYDGARTAGVRGVTVAADGSTTPLNGLREDRHAAYAGLRLSAFRSSAHHALKAGIDLQRETVSSTTTIALPGAAPFVDAPAQAGSLTGFYVQDRWSPSERIGVQLGARYDGSSGYVHGAQLSPRIGVNVALGERDVVHAYYGRLYAAPSIEDTRRDAVVTSGATGLPVYDLRPERDAYEEVGLAHRLSPGTSLYVNGFRREATNVLDTTQLAGTPLFAVFNNAVGRVWGIEARLQSETASHTAYLSVTESSARAGGVSGGTFLLNPDPAAAATAASDVTLQPEDHDQRWALKSAYVQRFGGARRSFASVSAEFGTGYPVQFQDGNGRLPAHWIVDAALGRRASAGGFGWELAAENLFDHRYPIKVNNGFNTTQWNAPRRVVVRVTAPW